MTSLLRAELLKLRTTRTFAALAGAALALSLLVVVLRGLLSKHLSADDTRDLFSGDFAARFIMLLGVIGMAGEWRHKTITGTMLAAPDRLRLLTAKVLSYAAAGAVLSLIVTLIIMAVGTIILSARSFDTASVSTLLDVLWRNLTVAALVGALGVGVGAVVRNQVVAIVGVLIVGFAIEPTLSGLLPHVGQFGPTLGAPSGIRDANSGPDDAVQLAPGLAVLVLFGWIGVFFAAAAARLRGGDLV